MIIQVILVPDNYLIPFDELLNAQRHLLTIWLYLKNNLLKNEKTGRLLAGVGQDLRQVIDKREPNETEMEALVAIDKVYSVLCDAKGSLHGKLSKWTELRHTVDEDLLRHGIALVQPVEKVDEPKPLKFLQVSGSDGHFGAYFDASRLESRGV
jgi:hypothetical protein